MWLSRIPEDAIVQDAAQLGQLVIKEFVVYFFQKLDATSFINFLELWLSTQGEFRKNSNMGTYYYTTHHNVNKKYSLFLEEFLFTVIENVLLTKVNMTELTPNLISFSFEVK